MPSQDVQQAVTLRRSRPLPADTGGRAAHTEEFDHYEEMPKDLEQKVIAESKKRDEEE